MKKTAIIEILLEMLMKLENESYLQALIYSFTLLTVKIISDTMDYKKLEYEKKYESQEKIQRLMRCQTVYLQESWTYIHEKVNYSELGQYINQYLRKLENNNPYLKGIFTSSDFTEIEYSKLKTVIQKLNYETLEIKNEEDKKQLEEAVDEVLLEKTSNILPAGESFTPKYITKLIANLSKVNENEEVADLVCGSGGLLIQVAKEVLNGKVQVYGQEINKKITNLCRINLLLHGIFDGVINCGDTINQNILDQKFDLVVANPPFSTSNDLKSKIEEREPFLYNNVYQYGIPPSSKSDYAFIQSMLYVLKSNGRMVSIIALGALSRGGAEEKIRINMVKDNIIDAIILLPGNLFRSTTIKTCIMICNKNKTQNDILFIDASKEFKKGRLQNTLSDKNLKNICKIYNERKNVSGVSYVATLDEVLENDANLSVNKYVIENKEDMIDIEKIENQIYELSKQLKVVEDKKKFYESKL